MRASVSTGQVVERLNELLATGNLPKGKRDKANRLIERLRAPVRVVFLGLPGLDQPRLVNGLLGRGHVPLKTARPPQEIRFGDRPRTTITRADGTIEQIDGEPDPAHFREALFLQRVCDAPILQTFSILDLALDGTTSGTEGAIRWAAPKADISVWCSQTFSDVEQAAWSRVPDRMKDHAFLALCADSDGSRAKALKTELGGEFFDIVPLGAAETSTETGSQGQGPALPAEALRPLSEALLRHVEEGRQADAANAMMFLRLNVRGAARAGAGGSRPPARVVPFEAAERDRKGDNTGSAATRTALRDACAFLRDRAEALLASLEDDAPLDAGAFVGECGEVIRQVSDMLDSAAPGADPALADLSDMLMEAEELAILLEIEREGQPEVDAACVLLQLRGALEAQLAA